MKIKCKRPIITLEGTVDLEYIFDTETQELTFDDKDVDILVLQKRMSRIS